MSKVVSVNTRLPEKINEKVEQVMADDRRNSKAHTLRILIEEAVEWRKKEPTLRRVLEAFDAFVQDIAKADEDAGDRSDVYRGMVRSAYGRFKELVEAEDQNLRSLLE